MRYVQLGGMNPLLNVMTNRQAFWDHIEACCGNTAAAHRSLLLPFWSDFDCGCGADSVSSCSDVCPLPCWLRVFWPGSVQHCI